MASTINQEAVELTLQQLLMSQGDQDGLADFLTDYFGSAEAEEPGKYTLQIHDSTQSDYNNYKYTKSDKDLEALDDDTVSLATPLLLGVSAATSGTSKN